MSNLSEPALHIVSGGHPKSKPNLEYNVFLPFLVHQLGITQALDFDTKGELHFIKDIIDLDISNIRERAFTINTRMITNNKPAITLCSKYSEVDPLTKASFNGYELIADKENKNFELKECIHIILSNAQGAAEFKYIIQSFLFREDNENTLKNLVGFILEGHVPIEIALSFSASCLMFLDQFLEILHQAYRANNTYKPYISGWLVSILSAFPHISESVAFHLSGWKIAPGVIRSVSFVTFDHQISFLNGLINSHTLGIAGIKPIDEPVSGNHPSLTQSLIAIIDCPDWLKDRAIQASSMSQYFLRLLDRFLNEPEHSFSSLCSFLRVISSFKLIYNIKFSLPIFNQVLAILSTFLEKIQVPTRFFDLCLCFVAIIGIDYNTQEQISAFLEVLFNHHFMTILHLVTAVRCNNLDTVSSFFSFLLGFRFKLERMCISKMKGLFTSRIFDEEILTNRMFSISSIDYETFTPHMQKVVATRHINYLLGCGIKAIRDKSYLKYNLDLQSWVCSLIVNLNELPMHCYLPIVIKEYVQCISPKKSDAIVKIPESLLVKHLHPKSKDWTLEVGPREVMLLYYTLLHNEKLAELSTSSPDVVPSLKYSDSLLDSIPVKRIMSYVEEKELGEDLAEFKAEFSGLTRSTFSHFFGVSNTLFVNKKHGEILFTPGVKYPTLREIKSFGGLERTKTFEEMLSFAIDIARQDSQILQHVLEFIKIQPSNVLLGLASTLIKKCLPLILTSEQNTTILDSFLELWNLLNNLTPDKLWLLTINNAQDPSTKSSNVRLRECTIQDLLDDPLVLARIDSRFFKVPQLFQIFITVLDSVRGASCSRFQRILRYRNLKQKNVFSADATRNMLCLQDTLVIQMVLEMCQDSYQASNQENIATIRHIAFNFIHLQFVETPAYIQVVHFQTYPLDLIPLAVEHVPSLYVAINDVPALLHHVLPANQWFGLVLASHLLKKYPLQSSFLLVEDPIYSYIKRVLGRLTITVSNPDSERWGSNITRLTGDLTAETFNRELDILKWVHNSLSPVDVEEVILRVASTSPGLATKLNAYIEPLYIPWDSNNLRSGLASMCRKSTS